MSFLKQALLSLVIIVVAAGGWYAYTHQEQLLAAAGLERVAAAAPAANGGGAPAGAGAAGPAAQNAQRAAQNGAPQGGARPGGAPGGGGPGGFGGARPLVVTSPVQFQAIGDDLEAVGSAAAVRAVTVYSQVSGLVAETPVKAGDKVKQGTLLVRLVNEDQKIALEKAKTTAADAKYALDRAEELNKNQNVTQVALATARSTYTRADIDQRTAQLDLDRRSIMAPFDGVVGLLLKTPGDYVTSQVALTTLDDTSKFVVSFDAPERFAARLTMGQEVTATADGVPGQVMKGTVTAIDSRVDETVRTFKVQATLDQNISALKPGMSVKVKIVFPTPAQATVPSLAVLWDRAGSYVWRVEGDQVHRVGVDILSRRNGTVVVLGPLKDNDPVVVEGVQRLRDGVAVTRAGAPAATGNGEAGARPAGAAGEGGRAPGGDNAPRQRGQT